MQLVPGERLVAAVPLFATDTSAPVFPVPGRYRLTARFHAGPAGVVAAEPVTVACAAGDDAAVRALGHRDVLQSLRRINESSRTTIVLVEQNVQAALREVERAIVLKTGRVIFDGPSAELAAKEDLWEWF